METSKRLKVGAQAPDFSLRDQDGKTHRLSDYKGQRVLLYFYVKDDSPEGIEEASLMRDVYKDLDEIGVKILGISIDSEKSHKDFEEKYKLPFTLLADTDKKVVNKYGVWGKKKEGGKEHMGTLRTTYLIDAEGNIEKVYENIEPKTHAEEVLMEIKQKVKDAAP